MNPDGLCHSLSPSITSIVTCWSEQRQAPLPDVLTQRVKYLNLNVGYLSIVLETKEYTNDIGGKGISISMISMQHFRTLAARARKEDVVRLRLDRNRVRHSDTSVAQSLHRHQRLFHRIAQPLVTLRRGACFWFTLASQGALERVGSDALDLAPLGKLPREVLPSTGYLLSTPRRSLETGTLRGLISGGNRTRYQ